MKKVGTVDLTKMMIDRKISFPYHKLKNLSYDKVLPRQLNWKGCGRDLLAVSDIPEKRLVTTVDGTTSRS